MVNPLVIAIPADNWDLHLKNLLSSLEWQTYQNFRVFILSNTLNSLPVSDLNLTLINPGHNFHRSRTRNAILQETSIDDEDLILFLDADGILSPNFLKDVVRFHDRRSKLVSYGLRKELTEVEMTNIPDPIRIEHFHQLNKKHPEFCAWTVRSMFQACKAKWLRAVGGYPEYITGWGGEDLFLHCMLIERIGCEEAVLPECIALHQWHPTWTDYESDAQNLEIFLRHRKTMIAEDLWCLTNRPRAWISESGKYLVETIEQSSDGSQNYQLFDLRSGTRKIVRDLTFDSAL